MKGAGHFIVKSIEYFIPLGKLIDKDVEIEKLKKELKYAQGFLNNVMRKLNNKRFVNNAPAKVVEKENIKKDDTEAKIKAIEEQIKNFSC